MTEFNNNSSARKGYRCSNLRRRPSFLLLKTILLTFRRGPALKAFSWKSLSLKASTSGPMDRRSCWGLWNPSKLKPFGSWRSAWTRSRHRLGTPLHSVVPQRKKLSLSFGLVSCEVCMLDMAVIVILLLCFLLNINLSGTS